MALSLDDLSKKSESKKRMTSSILTERIIESTFEEINSETDSTAEGEKRLEMTKELLRPWSSGEDASLNARTYASKEAVKRARKIARKNEELAKALRRGFVDDEKEKEIEAMIHNREKLFSEEAHISDSKIGRAQSFSSRFMDLVTSMKRSQ